MSPLTPESGALLETFHYEYHGSIDDSCDGEGCDLVAQLFVIEAAAAARATEPLVARIAELERIARGYKVPLTQLRAACGRLRPATGYRDEAIVVIAAEVFGDMLAALAASVPADGERE